MERRRFNVAISRMMEMTNLLRKAIDSGPGAADPAVREGAEALSVLLSVVAPFTAEDCWKSLGGAPSVIEGGWPQVDPELLVESVVTCVVQISGKLRARMQVPADIAEADLERLALAAPEVKAALAGAQPRRVIVRAPGLVNVVP
jgi:leucyl-tRNA synthetase